VHVLDQLLYMIPVAAAALAIVSLLNRRRRVASGLTLWLAVRLMFVWVIVLLVRLLFAAF
jgi:hypothetical protein